MREKMWEEYVGPSSEPCGFGDGGIYCTARVPDSKLNKSVLTPKHN